MAPTKCLTRTFVRDTLQVASHLVQTRWLVPSKPNHVWAFQGKSPPAVKSRSASLTVQTVNGKGSVEPSHEGRGTWPVGWSPFRFGPIVLLSVPPGRRERVALRRGGTLLEGGRALAFKRLKVVKPAPSKEASPGFNRGSVKM